MDLFGFFGKSKEQESNERLAPAEQWYFYDYVLWNHAWTNGEELADEIEVPFTDEDHTLSSILNDYICEEFDLDHELAEKRPRPTSRTIPPLDCHRSLQNQPRPVR